MTKSEFINLALRNIGLVTRGQTASTSDITTATTIYEAVYEQLQEEGLVTWGVDDDVPDWATMIMKTIVAPDLAREFNLPDSKVALHQAEYVGAFRKLLQRLNEDYQPEVIPAEYF